MVVAIAAIAPITRRWPRIGHRFSGADRRGSGPADAGAPQILVNGGDRQARPRVPGFWRFREDARWLYNHTYTQWVVACLIVGNFIMNIVECWIDPHKERFPVQFKVVEDMFNVAFTLELMLNAYSYWFLEFWRESWNWFDVMVVIIGLVMTFRVPMPGPLKLLRMMRAFRVFRLFRRIPSLRKIVRSLAKALPGVMNAFILQALFMSLFAVLSVDFYQLYGEGGTITTESGQVLVQVTARGMDHGFEYFGNFPKAVYTMFQMLTGDSWCEVVVRPLMITPSWVSNALSALFFLTFCIVNGVVLINIVVAVLLEKFADEDPAEEDSMVPEWTKDPVEEVPAAPTAQPTIPRMVQSPRPSPMPSASPAASCGDKPSKSMPVGQKVLEPPSGGLLQLPHMAGTTCGSEALEMEANQNMRQEVMSAKSEMDEIKRLMQVIMEGLEDDGQDGEGHDSEMHCCPMLDRNWEARPPSLEDVEPPPAAEVLQEPRIFGFRYSATTEFEQVPNAAGELEQDPDSDLKLHCIPSAALPELPSIPSASL